MLAFSRPRRCVWLGYRQQWCDALAEDTLPGVFTHDRVPEPRGWTEMCRLTNDSVLLVGGLSEKNERLRDAFKLRLHF